MGQTDEPQYSCDSSHRAVAAAEGLLQRRRGVLEAGLGAGEVLAHLAHALVGRCLEAAQPLRELAQLPRDAALEHVPQRLGLPAPRPPVIHESMIDCSTRTRRTCDVRATGG